VLAFLIPLKAAVEVWKPRLRCQRRVEVLRLLSRCQHRVEVEAAVEESKPPSRCQRRRRRVEAAVEV
jgi:hypothetical protein